MIDAVGPAQGPGSAPDRPIIFPTSEWGKFPEWALELLFAISGDVTSLFLLHFNVADLVFVEGHPPLDLKGFVTEALFDANRQHPDSSPKAPPNAPDRKENQSHLFRRAFAFSRSAGLTDLVNPTVPPPALEQDDPVLAALRRLEAELTSRAAARTLVVLEYLEKLAPAVPQGERDRIVVETLQRWALHQEIRTKRNVVVMLTTDRGQVHPELTTASSGIRSIRIDLPTDAQRLGFLRYLQGIGHLADVAAPEGGPWDLDVLAKRTAGFSLRHLRAMSDGVKAQKRIQVHFRDLTRPGTADGLGRFAGLPTSIGPQVVREYKEDLIVADSRELLENLEPRHGFESVGGLDHVVGELRRTARYFGLPPDHPAFRLVPRGLLFVGPPGTGKTHVARAFAKEAGMNMVKMKDIRSMWVGESERNLTRVLDLVVDLRPVVVFVDEIDQAIGQRDTGSAGDSGTSARMFGQILEFMGDNANRGRVLWVAASNRPDVLDAALLSRLDRVIPFLLPDAEARRDILGTMSDIVGLEYAFGPDDWAVDPDLRAVLPLTENTSGRELESVVRHALRLAIEDQANPSGRIAASHLRRAAEDFMPNHSESDYLLQELLAIKACNFRPQLPPREILERRPHLTGVLDAHGRVNADLLEEKIREVRLRALDPRASGRVLPRLQPVAGNGRADDPPAPDGDGPDDGGLRI